MQILAGKCFQILIRFLIFFSSVSLWFIYFDSWVLNFWCAFWNIILMQLFHWYYIFLLSSSLLIRVFFQESWKPQEAIKKCSLDPFAQPLFGLHHILMSIWRFSCFTAWPFFWSQYQWIPHWCPGWWSCVWNLWSHRWGKRSTLLNAYFSHRWACGKAIPRSNWNTCK